MAKSVADYVEDTRTGEQRRLDYEWMRDPNLPVTTARRWRTRAEVLRRIAELERLPPIRTQPTASVYTHRRLIAEGVATLSDSSVRTIRNLYVPGCSESLRKLAARYMLSEQSIQRVVTRKTYQHVV